MRTLHLNFLSDKQNIRFLNILALFEGRSEYTIRTLAKATGINERTLLVDIKNLRIHFIDCLEIESTYSGYHFKLIDPDKYAAEKRALIAHEPLFVIIESILVGERQSYEEWADHFFISESSMRRHIVKASRSLTSYQLSFSLNPVDLVGDEGNIRKFLKDFYYEADEISPFTLKPSVETDELMHYIKENRYQATVGTDILPTDFYYQFYIMIHRSAQNKYLSIPEIEQMDWSSDPTYRYFLSLKPKIFSRYGFEIPDSELLSFYLYSICKRTIDTPQQEELFCEQFNHWPSITQLAKEFVLFYDPILAQPDYPTETLIASFFTSVKYLDLLTPILNKNIHEVNQFAASFYPDKHSQTLVFLRDHWHLLDTTESYLEDVAASLVLTVEAIRDSYVKNPKRIAFLLEGSTFICRTIKSKATRYLSGYHELFFPTIEEMDNQFFYNQKIEIFVTNYADYVSYLEKDMDYILFKSIPDIEDWNHLLERINPQIQKDFSLNTVLEKK